MNTWKDLIDAWGGPMKWSDSLGVSRTAAYSMRSRNAVRSFYWPTIVAKAPSRGLNGITMELLATLQTGHKGAADDRRRPFRGSTPPQIVAQ